MRLFAMGLFDTRISDAPSIHFREIALSFSRLGHSVTVLLPRGDHARLRKARGITVHELPFSYRETLTGALLMNLVQMIWYVFLVPRDVDVVYIRWRLLPCTLIRWLNRIRGVRPLLVTEHNGWVALEVGMQRGSALSAGLAKMLQVRDARSADRVIAVTEGIRRFLVQEGVPGARITAAENGTDITHFRPLPDRAGLQRSLLGKEGLVLGFIGNIARWQGIDDMVLCFSSLRNLFPDLLMLIIGSGMYREELEARIRGMGMDNRIFFMQNIGYDEVNAWMNVMDIAFAPKSRELAEVGYSPLKIRDYAAAGKVVVSTDVPGIRELAPFGWLRTYDPSISGDCERVVGELLSQGALRREMELKARRYAEEHFSWDLVAERIAHVFPQASGDHSRQKPG